MYTVSRPRNSKMSPTCGSCFLLLCFCLFIMQTRPCNIQQLVTAVKNDIFQMKNCDMFLFFCSKHRIYIKRGCKGVIITRTCFTDVVFFPLSSCLHIYIYTPLYVPFTGECIIFAQKWNSVLVKIISLGQSNRFSDIIMFKSVD